MAATPKLMGITQYCALQTRSGGGDTRVMGIHSRNDPNATKWRSPAGLGYTDPVHYKLGRVLATTEKEGRVCVYISNCYYIGKA